MTKAVPTIGRIVHINPKTQQCDDLCSAAIVAAIDHVPSVIYLSVFTPQGLMTGFQLSTTSDDWHWPDYFPAEKQD